MTASTPPGDLPAGPRVAVAYEKCLSVAAQLLDAPRSVDIRTWEDGEIEVRVWHKTAVDGEPVKQIVRYRTREGWVVALKEIDRDTNERRVKWMERIDPDSVAVSENEQRYRWGSG